MKVWICDECGEEVSIGSKPDKCQCGSDSIIEIEKVNEGGCGCKGPRA
ncbi:MAG: hypothetical protein JSV56_03600 [Methanomassiliicoccales archaeon]|nr:MAG: hypothetical protein JSV56_03600 [Methanomassiliicoccales archaeon]